MIPSFSESLAENSFKKFLKKKILLPFFHLADDENNDFEYSPRFRINRNLLLPLALSFVRPPFFLEGKKKKKI